MVAVAVKVLLLSLDGCVSLLLLAVVTWAELILELLLLELLLLELLLLLLRQLVPRNGIAHLHALLGAHRLERALDGHLTLVQAGASFLDVPKHNLAII